MPHPFEQLDFLYTPSRDVRADVEYFTEVLGARLVFAVDSMGTRVAALELAGGAPLLLLADHLDGETPVLVYRVPSLSAALDHLERRGWHREATFEIRQGPICSFRTPGGHRIALYEITRPGAAEHLNGRRDF